MTFRTYIKTRGRAAELARRAGISVSTVTRIASGARNPSRQMIERLIAASDGDLRHSDFFAHPEGE